MWNPGLPKGRGALIVFEGISGAGKSHTIRQLYKHYKDSGRKTAIVEWNSNKLIRKIVEALGRINVLTSEIYSILQWTSFLIDYFTTILPLLKKDYYVIADRYIYTGLTRDRANETRVNMGKLISTFITQPDCIYFIDTPPRVCAERIEKRGKPLFHTNKRILNNRLLKDKDLYYLKRVRNQYLKLFLDLEAKTNINIIFKDTNVLIESDIGAVREKSLDFVKGGSKYGEELITRAKT